MNLPLHIAKRYLLAKKSTNAINIISGISIIGVMVGTMALVIVLSVFNGFENLVKSLYNAFDPQLKITAVNGKYLDLSKPEINALKKDTSFTFFCPTIEEKALVKYRDKQLVVTVKGVTSAFIKMTNLDTLLTEGKNQLADTNTWYALPGKQIAYGLSLAMQDIINPVTLYLPSRRKGYQLNAEDAFSTSVIIPSGIFSIQQEIDGNYMLVPYALLQQQLGLNNECSALELGIKPGINDERFKNYLSGILGTSYKVQNRYEQHELLYKVLKSEKWAVYLILSFILIIATFNIIGSLTMLIVEKKKDITILNNLGAGRKLITKIFFAEGMLINAAGALAGLLLGALICAAQTYFGIIKLGAEGTFLIENYPVSMKTTDFVYIFITVFTIGTLSSLIPAIQLNRSLR